MYRGLEAPGLTSLKLPTQKLSPTGQYLLADEGSLYYPFRFLSDDWRETLSTEPRWCLSLMRSIGGGQQRLRESGKFLCTVSNKSRWKEGEPVVSSSEMDTTADSKSWDAPTCFYCRQNSVGKCICGAGFCSKVEVLLRIFSSSLSQRVSGTPCDPQAWQILPPL